MMKKIMMIGLVVCGGVQGIQAMSVFQRYVYGKPNKPTRQQLGGITTSFLEMLHDRQAKKAATQSWEADLAAKDATARARSSISELGDKKFNQLFMSGNEKSPRSYAAYVGARHTRLKLKDTLTRSAIHPDIASLFAV